MVERDPRTRTSRLADTLLYPKQTALSAIYNEAVRLLRTKKPDFVPARGGVNSHLELTYGKDTWPDVEIGTYHVTDDGKLAKPPSRIYLRGTLVTFSQHSLEITRRGEESTPKFQIVAYTMGDLDPFYSFTRREDRKLREVIFQRLPTLERRPFPLYQSPAPRRKRP